MVLLIPVAKYLEQQLKAELIEQGHVASGDLLDSIKVEVENSIASWKLVGSNLEYGETLDKGMKPNVRVPVDSLIEWIRDKGINLNGKREKDVAFAIQTAIFRKGTPTDGDKKKTRWLSGTLEKETLTITEMIRTALKTQIELMISQIIAKM
jgi:phage gpG-like protein